MIFEHFDPRDHVVYVYPGGLKQLHCTPGEKSIKPNVRHFSKYTYKYVHAYIPIHMYIYIIIQIRELGLPT